MPKQTNLEWIRGQNRVFLKRLRDDLGNGAISRADYALAVERAREVEASIAEALRAARAPEDAIDAAKVLSNALYKALRSFEGEIAFDDPRPEHLADAARHLRSTVEDIVLTRRLLLEDEGDIESVLGLSE